MSDLHTHYDNLKVARNAPPEVIRAAYKSLSQRYHPDRNQDSSSATRVFQMINTAYDVLSDPVKRREHDAWIAQGEKKQRWPKTKASPRPPPQQKPSKPQQPPPPPTASPEDRQAWQQRTSFDVPVMVKAPGGFLRPVKKILRKGLTKRQAVRCMLASGAATAVLIALFAQG